jgi:hypothetical protein
MIRRADVLDLAIAILGVFLAVLVWTAAPGCSTRSIRAEALEMMGPPAPPPVTDQASADARVRRLTGELAEAKAEASAYRLEGVRRDRSPGPARSPRWSASSAPASPSSCARRPWP